MPGPSRTLRTYGKQPVQPSNGRQAFGDQQQMQHPQPMQPTQPLPSRSKPQPPKSDRQLRSATRALTQQGGGVAEVQSAVVQPAEQPSHVDKIQRRVQPVRVGEPRRAELPRPTRQLRSYTQQQQLLQQQGGGGSLQVERQLVVDQRSRAVREPDFSAMQPRATQSPFGVLTPAQQVPHLVEQPLLPQQPAIQPQPGFKQQPGFQPLSGFQQQPGFQQPSDVQPQPGSGQQLSFSQQPPKEEQPHRAKHERNRVRGHTCAGSDRAGNYRGANLHQQARTHARHLGDQGPRHGADDKRVMQRRDKEKSWDREGGRSKGKGQSSGKGSIGAVVNKSRTPRPSRSRQRNWRVGNSNLSESVLDDPVTAIERNRRDSLRLPTSNADPVTPQGDRFRSSADDRDKTVIHDDPMDICLPSKLPEVRKGISDPHPRPSDEQFMRCRNVILNDFEFFFQTPALHYFADWIRPGLCFPRWQRWAATRHLIHVMRNVEATLEWMIGYESARGYEVDAEAFLAKQKDIRETRIEFLSGRTGSIPGEEIQADMIMMDVSSPSSASAYSDDPPSPPRSPPRQPWGQVPAQRQDEAALQPRTRLQHQQLRQQQQQQQQQRRQEGEIEGEGTEEQRRYREWKRNDKRPVRQGELQGQLQPQPQPQPQEEEEESPDQQLQAEWESHTGLQAQPRSVDRADPVRGSLGARDGEMAVHEQQAASFLSALQGESPHHPISTEQRDDGMSFQAKYQAQGLDRDGDEPMPDARSSSPPAEVPTQSPFTFTNPPRAEDRRRALPPSPATSNGSEEGEIMEDLSEFNFLGHMSRPPGEGASRGGSSFAGPQTDVYDVWPPPPRSSDVQDDEKREEAARRRQQLHWDQRVRTEQRQRQLELHELEQARRAKQAAEWQHQRQLEQQRQREQQRQMEQQRQQQDLQHKQYLERQRQNLHTQQQAMQWRQQQQPPSREAEMTGAPVAHNTRAKASLRRHVLQKRMEKECAELRETERQKMLEQQQEQQQRNTPVFGVSWQGQGREQQGPGNIFSRAAAPSSPTPSGPSMFQPWGATAQEQRSEQQRQDDERLQREDPAKRTRRR